MSSASSSDVKLEIGHVLFIDIVGYTKLLIREQLKTLAKIPVGAEYGELRLDPFWDPIRKDPRFQKLAASDAPK